MEDESGSEPDPSIASLLRMTGKINCVNGQRSTVNGLKARHQETGVGRLEAGNRKGKRLVILRNEMTKNLVLTRISAGRRTFRFVPLVLRMTNKINCVNGEREGQGREE